MKIQLLLLLTISLLTLQSCDGGSNENQAEQDDAFISVETEDESGKTSVTIDSDNLGDALNKAMEDATDGKAKTKEVVDYQDLQDIMPSSIIGMERTAISGQKSGAMGQNLSTAEAEYESGNKSLKISAIDAGGSSFALAGLAMWADTEVSREDTNGYERTTKIDGYKAFEQYNKSDQTGQVNVLVEDRFIINIEGNNISGEELRRAMNKLNLKKLARMN